MITLTGSTGFRQRAAQGGLLLAFLLLSGGSALAAGSTQDLFIGGGQYSASSQFAYGGAIFPVDGGQLGRGLYVIPFLGVSRYTFQSNGTEFTGTQPAASFGIGRAWSGKRYGLSLSLAGGYSYTTLSPYSPPNAFRGAQWFAEPELYLQTTLPGKATMTINGGYLTGMRSYWATTFLLVPLTSRVAIGPEADFGGGINYENHTFALRISGQVTSRLSLAASFGAMTDVPGHFHPYVGFAVTRPFQ